MNYKIFILSFSLLVLSSNSFADRATPKSTYDWTGVYVGGFMGGATGSDVSNTATLDSDGSLWNDPGDANNNYSTKAGFIGGGTVGYNWQIGKTPYLVGLEGEYGYLSQKNSQMQLLGTQLTPALSLIIVKAALQLVPIMAMV